MKKYDVKEELTKPVIAEPDEETVEEETEETDKETDKPEVKPYTSRPKPVKLDITFIVIGILITVLIPVAAVLFFDLTKTGIILLIVCVGLLDALCFLAHRMMNQRIEV